MVKNVKNILSMVIVLFTTVNTPVNAQTIVDTTRVSDFEYVESVMRKTVNRDFRSVTVEKGRCVLTETVPNSGVELGVSTGVDVFNSNVTPTIGAEIGYHGRNLSFWGSTNFGLSKYNAESTKSGDKYLMTNFNFEAGLRLMDLPSARLHQKEVWLVGSFGYKVRKNFNAYTDNEHNGDLTVEVKGSTMTFGAGVRVDFKRYMQRSNVYIKALAYTGHEYFVNGSESRFGASLTVGINFVMGKKAYNEKAIRALYGSKAAYKWALKKKEPADNQY